MKRVYKRKLTLWQSGDTKPGQVGPYQFSGSDGPKHRRGAPIFYSYWNGKQWGMAATSPNMAKMVKERPHTDQNRAWRGRTQP